MKKLKSTARQKYSFFRLGEHIQIVLCEILSCYVKYILKYKSCYVKSYHIQVYVCSYNCILEFYFSHLDNATPIAHLLKIF